MRIAVRALSALKSFSRRAVVVGLFALPCLGYTELPVSADVINGSLEMPPTGPAVLIEIPAGNSPAGFGCVVNSGSVEVTHQGYVGGSGPFNGPASDGQQWLDLDGVSTGTISQAFATVPGDQYILSFAYAKNTYIHFSGTPSALVSVTNTAGGTSLITPFTISHNTPTPSNNNWTLSGLSRWSEVFAQLQ
jgi:hypothetical protein